MKSFTNKSYTSKVEELLTQGMKGAELGAVLTGKSQFSLIANITGIALEASIEACAEAEKICTPFMYRENDSLYLRYPNAAVEFFKSLPRTKLKIPANFTID